MSQPIGLPAGHVLSPVTRVAALCAVVFARLLSELPARRVRQVMSVLRRRAGEASFEQALAARHAVEAVSVRCRGRHCLQRSIAVAALCRARGHWPTWRTGVQTEPFRAHAWVEADGRLVGEDHGIEHFVSLLEVAPIPRTRSDRRRGRPRRRRPDLAALALPALLLAVTGPSVPPNPGHPAGQPPAPAQVSDPNPGVFEGSKLLPGSSKYCELTTPPADGIGRTDPPPWSAPRHVAGPAAIAGLCVVAHPVPHGTHYHAHLDVLVDGRPITVAAHIGLDMIQTTGTPLHTHDTTGLIHMEGPPQASYTLGQFFTEWQVALSARQLGGLFAEGGYELRAYVNGRRYSGDPASIVFHAHDEIALVYGPVGQHVEIPSAYRFPKGA